MVDPISPVGGFDELPYIPSIQGEQVQKVDRNSLLPAVDVKRLKDDKDYYVSTMRYTLERAQVYFRNFQYTAAQKYYDRFFEYLRFYPISQYAMQLDVYPAIFEVQWLNEILGQKKQAVEFVNKQVLRRLEEVQAEKDQSAKALQKTIETYQQQALLPTKQTLQKEFPPENYVRLAQETNRLGQASLAKEFLQIAEGQQQLALRRIQSYQSRLNQTDFNVQQLDHIEQQGQPAALPNPALVALPVAPYLPTPPEVRRQIESKAPEEAERYVERVEPISGLNRDPWETPEDRRRQRRKRDRRRQRYQSFGKSKPTITF